MGHRAVAAIARNEQVEPAKNLAIVLGVQGVAIAVKIGVNAMTGQPNGEPPSAEGPRTPWSPASGAVSALPSPDISGGQSLNDTLRAHRSVREFAPTAITKVELGQLLWAAQGVTSADGHRTAPSAGARHPPMGAFDDTRVAAVLGLAAGEQPLYLIPVGRGR
jgi:hypothetical protein